MCRAANFLFGRGLWHSVACHFEDLLAVRDIETVSFVNGGQFRCNIIVETIEANEQNTDTRRKS